MRSVHLRSASVDEPATTEPRGRQPWAALSVLLVAVALDLMGSTSATLAVPSIADDLDADPATSEWIVAGYGLAFALGLVTGGRLGDAFGRRSIFVLGLAGFSAASAVCGLAPTAEVLVAARVIQGACAALMVPQVLAIISTSFPAGARTTAYGLFGATAGIATVAGPLVSGVLLESELLGWRSIFLVNVPLGVLLIGAARRLVPESRSEVPPRFDVGGVVVLTVALLLLFVPLIEGPARRWPTWTVVMLALVLPVAVVLTAQQRRGERRGASPLLPPRLFARRSFTAGIVAALTFFSVPPALFFITTLYLQGVGFGPFQTALAFVPLALASIPTAASSSRLSARFGRRVPVSGAIVTIAGLVGLLLAVHGAGAAVTAGDLLPGMVLTGAGLGLVSPTLIAVVLADVDPMDAGAASGALNTALQVGGAGGIALAGLVFFHRLPAEHAAAADRLAAAFAAGLWYLVAATLASLAAMTLLPRPRTEAGLGKHPRGV